MDDCMHLIGAEAVQSAGHEMAIAAEGMRQAAAGIEDSLLRHRLWADEWMLRFERAVEDMGSAVAHM